MKCIFSIDVEDWYHILDVPSTPPISQWDTLPSRIERNFFKLLDLFEERSVSVTCFFLGWVALRYPHLVKHAQKRGHEIASHGFAHRLVYQMTPHEFCEDAIHARKILEDTVGRSIWGFRCPGFSVTAQVPWFFDKLIEAGYRYDSSVFPAPRAHGGLDSGVYAPYLVGEPGRELIEFPITVSKVLGLPICCFGGGYLRMFPLSFIRRMTRRVLRENRPVVFYVHPREIDPSQPRLPMNLLRTFKSYVNVGTTQDKLRGLVGQFPATTFRDFIDEHFVGEHRHRDKDQPCAAFPHN
jgi:polysaccharide deacetylase family protein (PEP-CTERM system associated)